MAKRTKKLAKGGSALSFSPSRDADDIEVEIPQEAVELDDTGIRINPDTGSVEIDHGDGSVTIDLNGDSLRSPDEGPTAHEDNLADKIDLMERSRISEELITAIEADKQDRSQWETMRAKALELLGMKLEEPKADVSSSGMGMSTSVVRDPILLEAVERFRANAFAELCPAAGPVKVVDFGNETASSDDLANALQKDLNFYLTTTASEYYPDTRYMLWWTGLASGTFKKVYTCPLRRRPVSEYVDGTHLIIPSNATDLKNAGRVTHESTMRRATMRRMQIAGVYRDIDLSDPTPVSPNAVDQKKASIEGKSAQPQRPEDQEYTIYECYCELDIPGFEHEEDGEPSGLPLPYRVTIEEGSRQILEIRRNWEEEDEDQLAQIPFVLFPYSTGLSRIYGSGLGQMGGNIAAAMTALLRISIDGGMLANYPGLLKAKSAGRQITNEIRVPPGGCAEIDTGGLPIQQTVMGMPYKDVSGNVVQLMEMMRVVGQRLMGTAELPVGEGKQDAPVGTTLAMIEQATKIQGSVHKALHAAQSEEFRLLVKLFRRDPESLWRGNMRPALGADKAARLAKFKAALDNCDIVPMADPNVPSEMHRILKATALKQLTAGNPQYDQIAVDRRVAEVLKVDDFDSLLAPPQQGPPDPAQMLAQIEGAKIEVAKMKVRLDAQKAQWQAENAKADRESREQIEATKLALGQKPEAGPEPLDPFKGAELALERQAQNLDQVKLFLESQNKKEDREAKLAVEAMKIANTVGIHPEADAQVDNQLNQMAAFIKPAAKGAADGGTVEAENGTDLDELLEAFDLAARISNSIGPTQIQ